ncbi:hypothetical protein [Actinoplanes xinjiangensis]|uniref:hypothetical protein n=1 Tax=Actinoplanes xinjiangensis TaxID=512350 RepID=UPI0034483743
MPSPGWRALSTSPSALGDGLVDVALDARIPEPLAANDRPLWDMWRAGGSAEPHLWRDLDRSGRYLWVQAAAVHQLVGHLVQDGVRVELR